MEQQSEVSLQNHAHSAGKWHMDSELKMGSGPVVFLVLLWQWLRLLALPCFLSCSGQPDFPSPVHVSQIPPWITRSLFMATHGSSSAVQYCIEVCISSKMCSVGWLLHWCCCAAEGELRYRHSATLPSAPRKSLLPFHGNTPAGSGCWAPSWHRLPCSTSTFLPSLCLKILLSPMSRC